MESKVEQVELTNKLSLNKKKRNTISKDIFFQLILNQKDGQGRDKVWGLEKKGENKKLDVYKDKQNLREIDGVYAYIQSITDAKLPKKNHGENQKIDKIDNNKLLDTAKDKQYAVDENIRKTSDDKDQTLVQPKQGTVVNNVRKIEKYNLANHVINEGQKEYTLNNKLINKKEQIKQEDQNIAYVIPEVKSDTDNENKKETGQYKFSQDIDRIQIIVEKPTSNIQNTDPNQNNFTDTNSRQFDYSNNTYSENGNNIQQAKFTLSLSFMDTKINIQTIYNNLIMYINTQQNLTESMINGIHEILSEIGYDNYNLIVKDKEKTTKVYSGNNYSTQSKKRKGLSIFA